MKGMKKLIFLSGMLLLTLISVPGIFGADYPAGGGRGEGGQRGYDYRGPMIRQREYFKGRGELPALWAKLNLTETQKSRLKILRESHVREINPLQEQIFGKSGDLRLLWLQPDPDREKIVALQREIRNLREQMQEKATAQRLDVLNILTPEQQERIRSLLAEQGPGFGARGGMKPRPGPGPMGP